MTDRELLELAAKAAGIDSEFDSDFNGMWLKGERNPDNSRYWNPLTDDGDALRMAVYLAGLHPEFNEIIWRWTGRGIRVFASVSEGEGKDLYEATRRAIVLAAAEIGKEKK